MRPARSSAAAASPAARRASDSSPISSTSLDVDLVADQGEEGVAIRKVAAGQGEPQPGQRLADPDAGRARAASGPARPPSGSSPSPARAPRRGRRRARPPASASGGREFGRLGETGRRGSRTSTRVRNGRIGAAIRLSATSAAWRVANAASRSAASSFREQRSRERRRYQVERSSMNVAIVRVAPTAS